MGVAPWYLCAEAFHCPFHLAKKACSSSPLGFSFGLEKGGKRPYQAEKKHIIGFFPLHYSKAYKIKGIYYQCGKYKAPYSLEGAGEDRRQQNVSMFSECGACFTRTWILLRRFAFVYQRCTDFDAAKPHKSRSCC